ncbi:uncharacterized protein METZ01_LOCUS516150, partial [marine metagenome]
FMNFMKRFRQHMHKVEIGVGSLLVVTGVVIFTGDINEFANWLLETFPIFSAVG